MGTRADFYVGIGKNAEWVGSVAYDGHWLWEDDSEPIMQAKTEKEFRAAVEEEFNTRDDATRQEQGWPWPWNDSCTTDYAYCWNGESVESFCFGEKLIGFDDEGYGVTQEGEHEFPDMSKVKNVTYGSRSGVLILSVSKDA